MALKVGDKASDFSLLDSERKERTLKEFSGKKLVIAFIPGAFTGVCTKELCTLRDTNQKFNSMNAQVLSICVDSPFVNKAYVESNELNFPVLSDYSRETIRRYCGLHEDFAGMKGYSASKRSVFVVDKEGIIKYAWISENPGQEPPYDEIVKSVASL